jgi:hypothetical protein
MGATATGTYSLQQGNQFPVTPGEEYYVEAWVHGSSGSGGTWRIELQFQDTTASANSYARLPDTTFTNGKSWTKVKGRIVVPDTVNGNPTVKARLYVSFRDVTATTGAAVRVANVYMRRANSADLIVDGAITANKLTIGQLSLITDNAGTIIAGMLRSSDSKMQVDLNNKRILIAD